MNSPFLIAGCPRSGTHFISKFFLKNGYKVEHEDFMDNFDGVSSWLHILNNPTSYPKWWKGKKVKIEFKKIIHQVRNPLHCISSMMTISDPSYNLMKNVLKINNKDKLITLMEIWLGWNKMIEKNSDFSYTIEDLELVLPKLNKELDINLKNISLSKKVNSRRHRLIDKKELIMKNESLTNEIFEYYKKIKL